MSEIPSQPEISSSKTSKTPLAGLVIWMTLLFTLTLGALFYGYFQLEARLVNLEKNLNTLAGIVPKSGGTDVLENHQGEQVTEQASQEEVAQQSQTQLDNYKQIEAKLASLEKSLNTLEATVPNLPRATIDAIVSYQNEQVAEQRAEQEEAALDQAKTEASNTKTLQVGIDNDAFIGDTDAPIVLIEFSDLNCGFCGRFHQDTFSQLLEDYIETGKVRYVYRDYIGVGGQVSQQTAAAAECAREQLGDNDYVHFVHDMYLRSGRKNVDLLREVAAEYNLVSEDLETCIAEERYVEEVRQDTRDGQQVGIRGTPGFIVGSLNEDGTIQGANLQGAQPYRVFDLYLKTLLGES